MVRDVPGDGEMRRVKRKGKGSSKYYLEGCGSNKLLALILVCFLEFSLGNRKQTTLRDICDGCGVRMNDLLSNVVEFGATPERLL